jgi:hypothetical protein
MRTTTLGDETDLGPNPPQTRRPRHEREDAGRAAQGPYVAESEIYNANHVRGPDERDVETQNNSEGSERSSDGK